MAKITSKMQVTVPRAIADRYGLEPGDEIEFQPAGEVIRIAIAGRRPNTGATARLRLFDAATERQRERERASARAAPVAPAATERGWTREELYERARPR